MKTKEDYLNELRAKIEKMDIPEENKRIIFKFDNELMARNLSPCSRVHYVSCLVRLMGFSNKKIKELTKDDIIAFFIDLEKKGGKLPGKKYKKNTIGMFQKSIKTFFKWLHGGEYPKAVKWIKVYRGKSNNMMPEELLTKEDVKKMIEVSCNPRDSAFIACLYESGCRVSEIITRKIKHATFDQYGAVMMVDGKTGPRRIRLIDSASYLSLWLNYHPYRDDNDAPLFTSLSPWKNKRGKQMSYCAAIQTVKNLGKLAGVKKKIYTHLFRHSRLTELVKLGFTESELRIMAGWSGYSKMPEVYVHLSGRDVEDKILKIHGIKNYDVKKADENLKPKTCPRKSCNYLNPPTLKFCGQCGLPLDIKTAIQTEDAKETYIDVISVANEEERKKLVEFRKSRSFSREQIEEIKQIVKRAVREGLVKIK